MTEEQLEKIIRLNKERAEKRSLLNAITKTKEQNSGRMIEFWGTNEFGERRGEIVVIPTRFLKSITSAIEEEIAEINSELSGMKIIESNNRKEK